MFTRDNVINISVNYNLYVYFVGVGVLYGGKIGVVKI